MSSATQGSSADRWGGKARRPSPSGRCRLVKAADAWCGASGKSAQRLAADPARRLLDSASVAIDLSTVDTLQAALTYHRERHTVLAGNIANLDTPGYRPVDLERHPADDPSSLAVTHEGHIATAQTGDVVTSFDDGGRLQGSDGNSVTLERELSKIDANRTRYSTSAELTSRRLAMLRYAAGDGT
jgi:flagellar basal-body rod protein FlgB